MPDSRKHRGAHPEDRELFSDSFLPALRSAVADLSWLFTHGYAEKSALKLVGDRHRLTERQRIAVLRASCSDQALERRRQHRVEPASLAGETLLIDGYNVLLTVESALGGGVILACRDGCCRDLASVHGTYRKVAETIPAIELLGHTLAPLGLERCHWHLDRPVSNSGRLKTILTALATRHGWPWTVELSFSPDTVLASSDHIVATADSAVLDRCERWFDLASSVVESTSSFCRVSLVDRR